MTPLFLPNLDYSSVNVGKRAEFNLVGFSISCCAFLLRFEKQWRSHVVIFSATVQPNTCFFFAHQRRFHSSYNRKVCLFFLATLQVGCRVVERVVGYHDPGAFGVVWAGPSVTLLPLNSNKKWLNCLTAQRVAPSPNMLPLAPGGPSPSINGRPPPLVVLPFLGGCPLAHAGSSPPPQKIDPLLGFSLVSPCIFSSCVRRCGDRRAWRVSASTERGSSSHSQTRTAPSSSTRPPVRTRRVQQSLTGKQAATF